MPRVIVLDSGPLGLAGKSPRKPDAKLCRDWLRNLDLAGALIVVPAIADFEVRRELLRTHARAGILRLDVLLGKFLYAPTTRAVIERAAEYWAHVRQLGMPTESDPSLGADCIVAASASVVSGLGDVTTIATDNVAHLIRFPGIDAREWEQIAP